MENKKRLIDANAFIKHFERARELSAKLLPGELCEILHGLYDEVIEEIKKQPTFDAVEVVHGKWVKKTADCVYYYACSECEEPVLKSRWGHDCFTRYCPNCGARMDGDENA